MKKTASLFKALADPTRLEMLALLLRQGELCVCDFEHVLDITHSKASRHLRYLLNAGYLQDRRAGIWVYYRVTKDLAPEPKAILKTVRLVTQGDRALQLIGRLDRWLQIKDVEKLSC